MLRTLRRCVTAALTLLLVLAAFFWTFAAGLPSAPPATAQADLLAVFGGSVARLRPAVTLEQAGHFRYFVYSDTPATIIGPMTQSLGGLRQAALLDEPDARSTTQNARYVSRLVRTWGLQSMVLMTDWQHLPRACILLRLALLGTPCRCTCAPAQARPADWWRRRETFYEFQKFLGSLGTWRDWIWGEELPHEDRGHP